MFFSTPLSFVFVKYSYFLISSKIWINFVIAAYTLLKSEDLLNLSFSNNEIFIAKAEYLFWILASQSTWTFSNVEKDQLREPKLFRWIPIQQGRVQSFQYVNSRKTFSTVEIFAPKSITKCFLSWRNWPSKIVNCSCGATLWRKNMKCG